MTLHAKADCQGIPNQPCVWHTRSLIGAGFIVNNTIIPQPHRSQKMVGGVVVLDIVVWELFDGVIGTELLETGLEVGELVALHKSNTSTNTFLVAARNVE